MSYVTFNIDLNLYSKKKSLVSNQCISTYLSLVVLDLLILSECEKEGIVMFIIGINPNIGNIIELSLKFSKISSIVISCYLATLHILYINYACNLHSLPYDISNMVSLVY